ncbi:endonuclease [Raphidocelis subcapitata]|uniref:Endonuclease n=1 Tax=Raphidocelis subcapitata TaxID=307507 RepID=A0A2V0PMU6_9CHLO|nr:endonuclease [Raphidocelis subcapitata]|eukprot:GBF98707.1 endonuclease [Raphidocelis subcapitata]
MAAEAALSGLRLGASQAESELLLQQTEEAGAASLPIEGVLDLRPAIEAAAAGSVLNAKQLEGVAASLEAALQLRAAACIPAAGASDGPQAQAQEGTAEAAAVQGARFPALASLAEAIPAEEAATVAALRACIQGGSVTDRADAKLAATRAERTANLSALRELVTATARDLAARGAAESREPLLVRGRFCVGVRSNRRSELPKGSVKLGASTSGATVYMEPAGAVELNNRETELAGRERELEVAVLARLSAALGRRGPQLAALLAAVRELDLAAARAAHAAWMGGVRFEFVSRAHADTASPLHVPGLLHPLLLEAALPPLPRPPTADDRPFASDFAAVPTFWAQPPGGAGPSGSRERAGRPHPLDLRVPPAKSVVTITGPNTGGKTVTLKAAGLAALMAKAGLFLAVEAGSPAPRLCWFSSVLADIGDSQSLQQNLSTFSGHVRRLRRVLAAAGPSSLVLLDEVGSGTDPGEGAALARAVLDALAPRGGLTLATSHHAELKALPAEDARFANAAMGFDTASLAPTYELAWGAAGASNALDIAARLGFDGAVVADARALAASEEAARAAAAADMERVAASIEAQLADARARLERRRQIRAEAEERLAGLRTTERLLSGLRGTVARGPALVRQVVSKSVLELQLALAESRRGASDAAALSKRLDELEAALPPRLRPGGAGATGGGSGAADGGPALAVGDRVTVPKLGVFGEGTVVKVSGGTVTVDVKLPGLGRSRGSSKPVKVAADEVVRQDEARAAAAAAGAESGTGGRGAERTSAYAVLLSRVDDALAALEAGDGAVVNKSAAAGRPTV